MEKELQNLKEEIDELKSHNQFLEEIINNAPAFIYINQVDKIGDTSTMKNIWGNNYFHEAIKYNREEINEMGFNFFEKILHPDELSYTTSSIDFLN